jgi:hypothetical protein
VKSTVIVEAVTRRSQVTEFIRMPYEIYRGDDKWTPPLETDLRTMLDPRKHPFFEFGSADLFLARRDGRVAGRIAAVNDPRFNEYQRTRYGFFGFFECVDDVEVARALFDAVEERLGRHDFEALLGPMSYTTNYDCGLLIDGFHRHPGILTPYNPPYYAHLLADCGFRKEKDLWSWDQDVTDGLEPPEGDEYLRKIVHTAEAIRADPNITVRQARIDDFVNEFALVREVYNAAWSHNWGFVPTTEREFEFIARQLKPLVRPGLALIVEDAGEAVGIGVAFIDPGPALRAAGGRLFRYGLPLGLLPLLRVGRTARRVRVIVLGIKPHHRYVGVAPALVVELRRAAYRLGYRDPLEASWILENNRGLNRLIEAMGSERVRTHRVFRRETFGR